jgi:hypothetical protein
LILHVIEVKERADTVPEGEKPVHWVLLTSRRINNLSEALQSVRCYALRWQIELIFATLKSNGLNIEASQLESGQGLKSMVAMSLITALRINQMRMARENTELRASIIMTTDQIIFLSILVKTLEGNTERQKNPYPNASIGWAVWAIARLGGWKGYTKNESPPGNKTLLTGWNDFNRLYHGWILGRPGP